MARKSRKSKIAFRRRTKGGKRRINRSVKSKRRTRRVQGGGGPFDFLGNMTGKKVRHHHQKPRGEARIRRWGRK